jgi:electron transfer flavoprotein alpha subunit
MLWVFGDVSRYMLLPADTLIHVKAGGVLVAERYIPALAELCKNFKPDIVLFYSGIFGDELAVRTGFRAGGSTAIGVTRISPQGEGVIIARRVWGLQLEGEFLYTQPPYVFSIARDSFPFAEESGSPAMRESGVSLSDEIWYQDCSETVEEPELRLDTYDLVLVGGRGIASKANMETLKKLGETLGAGVGATRPAALNGWLPADKIIGLSGAVVKPKLCLVFGSSGCTPFLKGIDKSGIVIAINTDAAAPIFDGSDVGIVGDCVEAANALLRKTKSSDF